MLSSLSVGFIKNTFVILFCRFKEMKMNAIIKEVALYVFFVACLCIVSYSHRDPTSFAFRQTMYNSFVEGVHGGKKSFSAVSGDARPETTLPNCVEGPGRGKILP